MKPTACSLASRPGVPQPLVRSELGQRIRNIARIDEGPHLNMRDRDGRDIAERCKVGQEVVSAPAGQFLSYHLVSPMCARICKSVSPRISGPVASQALQRAHVDANQVTQAIAPDNSPHK